jgi:hypothetical protein
MVILNSSFQEQRKSFAGIINSKIRDLLWRCVSNMIKAWFQFVYVGLSVIKYKLYECVYHFTLICHSLHMSCDYGCFLLSVRSHLTIPMSYLLGSIGCIHTTLTVPLLNSFHSRVYIAVKLIWSFFFCTLWING